MAFQYNFCHNGCCNERWSDLTAPMTTHAWNCFRGNLVVFRLLHCATRLEYSQEIKRSAPMHINWFCPKLTGLIESKSLQNWLQRLQFDCARLHPSKFILLMAISSNSITFCPFSYAFLRNQEKSLYDWQVSGSVQRWWSKHRNNRVSLVGQVCPCACPLARQNV